MLTESIGYLPDLFLSLCSLPKILKTLRSKHADDESMGMLIWAFAPPGSSEIYARRHGPMLLVVMCGTFGLLRS